MNRKFMKTINRLDKERTEKKIKQIYKELVVFVFFFSTWGRIRREI